MASTILYLGEPGAGKSYLMRAHVRALASDGASRFLGVDHDDSWADDADIYYSIPEWLDRPSRVAMFRGVEPSEVVTLTIAVGWATYVAAECDGILAAKWRESPLREIVKRGRHLRNARGEVTAVSAMLCTHRPANLPPDIIGLFSRVYLGRLRSLADAERIHREGWLPGSSGPLDARRTLEARAPGDFTTWP